MKIVKNGQGIYHVYSGEPNASMLYRYGIVPEDKAQEADGVLCEQGGAVTLKTTRKLAEFIPVKGESGYTLEIPLSPEERLFGAGDASRESMMIRGREIQVRIDDFVSYGPMPVLISDQGWGLIINSTYSQVFDCGKSNPDRAKITVSKGDFDFYLIEGGSLKEVLSRLTLVSGRPTVMPKFAYGLSFVENEEIDARSMLWDIKALRDRDIPCDVLGLEPNWMETRYDFTVNKKWNRAKFNLPSWEPVNTSSDFTFFYPMRKMGMNLSLWLCSNYDLLYYEDKNFEEEKERDKGKQDGIVDENLAFGVKMDNITDIKTPWFEHLKKFVDNGAAAFKLDGSTQILHHRDRLWGGKYLDDEVHNIYPVLLAKQTAEGFKSYTDRRIFLYTAGAYLGIQQYAATWAGDTGGGEKTVLSILNQALCGHSNTTCDLEVKDPLAIHYGFLTPWAQYFCWANWKYPWFMGDETEELIRTYARLRSSLVPYIYSMAHVAYRTGIAIVRPLLLMNEDTDRFDDVKNAYMLGDKLYVGVFNMSLKLPDGKWIDYWTGEAYEGDVEYKIPEGKAGALLVREGSVFVTMKPQKYVLEKAHDYIVNVYPGADDSFTLYEDDGFTYDYQSGGSCTTDFLMENTTERGFELKVCKRVGDYAGRPDNGSDIASNSIPEIPPCGPVTDMEIKIFGRIPAAINCDGEAVAFEPFDGGISFTLPACKHEKGDVVYRIDY